VTVPSTVYVTIGNSDDKLTQVEWARFYAHVDALVDLYSNHVFGRWVSLPTSRYQNACWGFAVADGRPGGQPPREVLRQALSEVARDYRQENIAWCEGTPEFLAG
jgi:hypothetical protein